MKKLATILGSIVCLAIMKQPKTKIPPQTVNNYYSGCGGSCSGNCGHCGKH